MRKKRCDCGHVIESHSHLNWHDCKEDNCGCSGFQLSIHLKPEGDNHG